MKTESVFYGLLLLILILKMNAIQGAAPLLIVLLGTLSMLYFPMGFYFLSGKGIYNQHVLPTVLGMLSFSVVILGYLFRVMNWPGSNAMGLIGARHPGYWNSSNSKADTCANSESVASAP